MRITKKIVLTFIIIACLCGCSEEKINNNFKVDLQNEPYTICGKEIFLSDYSYNNELEIENIFANVEELCNFQKIENAKDEINDLLDDDGSYSRREILERLQKIYYNYLDN